MKALLSAGLAVLMMAPAAMAASAPMAEAPAMTPAASSNWSGFYAGILAGANLTSASLPGYDGIYYGNYYDYYYGGGQDDWNGGGSIGGTLGANMQMGNFVLGIDGDINWTNHTSVQQGYETYSSAKMNWFSTLRVNAGVVIDDTALIYATAGIAAANIDYSVCANTGCDPSSTYDYGSSGVQWGLAAGVGAEAKVTDNLSVKAEALYIKLAGTQVSVPYDAPEYFATFGSSMAVVQAGLNWHFN